jgi:hypothetical protein
MISLLKAQLGQTQNVKMNVATHTIPDGERCFLHMINQFNQTMILVLLACWFVFGRTNHAKSKPLITETVTNLD